jgi:hypothetical protein
MRILILQCKLLNQPVAGREALMTILAKFNENGLHVHRFVRELALVLSLYNQIISGTGFNWFSDLEDEASFFLKKILKSLGPLAMLLIKVSLCIYVFFNINL